MAVLRSVQSFFVGHRRVTVGQIVDSTDPIVAGREHLFESPEAAVEQATAAPGEKRSTRRAPAKKRAKGDA